MRFILLIISLLFTISQASAQIAIPDPPKKLRYVYDYADLLSRKQAKALDQAMKSHWQSDRISPILVIIDTLYGQDEIAYAKKWLTRWEIAEQGLIVLMSQKDRKVRIQFGPQLRSYLDEKRAEEIIETLMVPPFREGKYHKGLKQATDALLEIFPKK